jgi:hypothetical protein
MNTSYITEGDGGYREVISFVLLMVVAVVAGVAAFSVCNRL